jgi:hypothetical protein
MFYAGVVGITLIVIIFLDWIWRKSGGDEQKNYDTYRKKVYVNWLAVRPIRMIDGSERVACHGDQSCIRCNKAVRPLKRFISYHFGSKCYPCFVESHVCESLIKTLFFVREIMGVVDIRATIISFYRVLPRLEELVFPETSIFMYEDFSQHNVHLIHFPHLDIPQKKPGSNKWRWLAIDREKGESYSYTLSEKTFKVCYTLTRWKIEHPSIITQHKDMFSAISYINDAIILKTNA